MRCDMCGKEIEKPILISVEGAQMQVCSNCAKFGKVVRQAQKPVFKRKIQRNDTRILVSEEIVSGYGTKIKNAREKLGLSQKDFSKKINEKESLLHQIESEHIKPKISTAKKIGIFLGIDLTETVKVKHTQKNESSKSGVRTIGDILKNKINLK